MEEKSKSKVEARIRVRIDELKKFGVTLPDDPISLGISKMNRVIATVRAQLDRASQIVIEAIEMKNLADRSLRAAKASYEDKRGHLLAYDDDVRAGKSQAERDAVADTHCRGELNNLRKWEIVDADVKSFHTVALHVFENLRKTRDDIGLQLAVVKQSLIIGEVSLSMGKEGSGNVNMPKKFVGLMDESGTAGEISF